MKGREWDDIYRAHDLKEIPWHTSQPDRFLVRLVREGKIPQGAALDMCSGDGTNSLYLASKGFQVTGIDISETAVKIARSRCAKRKLRCDYIVGNVLELKIEKKFDLVFDRGCFHHIPVKSKPIYAQLVHRLLREGGKYFLLCFSDKNPPLKKNLSKEDIRRYFSPGFRILFIKDSIHRESLTGNKRYLYACFMEKTAT